MKKQLFIWVIERRQAPMGDFEPILMIVAHGAKSSTMMGQSRKDFRIV